TQNAFRIQYTEGEPAEMPEWIYVENGSLPLKKKVQGATTTLVSSAGTMLCVDADRQEVSVKDHTGKLVFRATKHQLKAATVAGENTHEATLMMESPVDESLYGLGQFQDGYVNVRGLSRRLTQVNTQISVPMFLSNKGYGVLWNNYGMTEFNPAEQSVALVKQEGEGVREVVNVTSTTGGKSEVRVRNLFKAQFSVPTKGMYSLLLDVGQTMARRHTLSIDGKLLVDHRNIWLPPTTSILCELEAGNHTIEAELERDDKPVVYYKSVDDQTVLRSPMAEAVDYTVFVGSADEIIAAYRQVTGAAPMMPKWALGYIHCRERFHSSDEIIQTAKHFRDEQIPLDLIVQDWQWWGKYGWNAMKFDEDHYPDPRKLTDDLHDMDVRLMLSVWSKIDKNSEVGKSMLQQGYYIPGTDWIDFFNPEAAAAYWKVFSQNLLPYGIDAWWQDATEPENDDLKGRRVWNGKYVGERFRN
ncbi:MAG: glycosyl hydrolase family 31, partial [Bacteroidaceae bacterium]|nr:glycosyl hydrolase family 31 [Bacteroidaceae bacterium]